MFSELDEQGVFERVGDWYLMYNVSENVQAKILGQLSGEARESIAQAQRETLDMSYCFNDGEPVNWFPNHFGAFQIIYNRTNTLNYTIYSAHSLNDGCDYYFIRSDVTTKTNGYIRGGWTISTFISPHMQ